MSRLQQILKLAQQTLTNYERIQLNGDLVSVHGYDYIDAVLNSKGFSRGEEFKKNYFYLLRGGERVDSCVLKGDYQRMQIVKFQEPKPPAPKPAPKPEPKKKKPTVPWDAYYSPAHFYNEWERHQEEDDQRRLA